MSFTYADLLKVNEPLTGTDIGKGKKYVLVTDRVKAFRQLCPGGSITTDILAYENNAVTIKATVTDEAGNVLSTGIAQEKEGSGFVNKTSFIENCETSAVGRALGFAGIGIDESMASAEEVANAILQQNALTSKITAKEQAALKGMIEAKGYTVEEIFKKPLAELTGEEYMQATKTINKMKNKGEK